MRRVNGQFFFKITHSGNLFGEYSNAGTGRPYTEAADRESDDSADLAERFRGRYHSFWRDTRLAEAKLVIDFREGSRTLYSLNWTHPKSGALLYTGEGMLVEGMLIGNYMSAQ